MELPQKIVDSKENLKGFIIVIDEFQLLKSLKSPEAFFWLIRSYAQKQYNVSYIFTGSVSRTSEILAMLNGQTGAFGGRMIQINIDPFTLDETKSYIEEYSNNISFTEEGFSEFFKYTKGIPTYINSFCTILPGNSICDEKTIHDNIKLNIDHIAIMWIYVWGQLEKIEKKIIIKLLENDGMNWTGLVSEMKYSKPTISKFLDSIANKGLAEYNFKNGKYELSDKMHKTWLKVKLEQDGRYPL